MDTDNWKKIKRVFDAALEKESGDRAHFLEEACADDSAMRREIDELLVAFGGAEGFLEAPAAEAMASLLVSTPHRLANGLRIGHYEIESMTGSGGIGEVYLAADKTLGRKVAIKVLNERHLAQESNLERFKHEAIAASALNHPNIVVIHEIGEFEGLTFLVSEYIAGRTLRKLILEKPLSEDEILDFAIQIASALEAAHKEGIIHRDIKPENIMIRPDGLAKVLDFGLAKLAVGAVGAAVPAVPVLDPNHTADGLIVGTVRYMSPEQASGKSVDSRTDIFSLGSVIYEMLTGVTPFEGETLAETVYNLKNLEAENPSRFAPAVSEELEAAVLKMLAKKRGDRYQSMEAVLADLRRILKQKEFETELRRSREAVGVDEDRKSSDWTSVSTGASSRSKTASVAVLPFDNLSDDRENDYFCEGLAGELLNALSKIERLKVAARTSSFTLKGKGRTLREIGEILKVKTVVEGSVRRSGDRVRIGVQLVDVDQGFSIWSETYDRELKDIYAVQDDIILAVAEALKIKLLSGEEAAVRKRYTQNTEAYLLYLKGVYYRWKLLPTEFQKCREYFQKAIDADPLFAPAYFGLSSYYGYGTAWGLLSIPTDEGWLKAEAALAKASEIDDSLPEIRLSLGAFSLVHYRDWETSGELFGETLEHAPNLPEIHHAYGFYLLTLGDLAGAIAESERALNLDPLSLTYSRFLGICLYFARRYDEAIRQFEKSLELDPENSDLLFLLGEVFGRQGMYSEAGSAFAAAMSLQGNAQAAAKFRGCSDEDSLFGAVREMADRNLSVMRSRIDEGHFVPAIGFARMCVLNGDVDEAFEWLRKAIDEHNVFPLLFNTDPFYDGLREDPRFKEVLNDIGFSSTE